MSGMQALAAALQGGMDGYLRGTSLVRSREREDGDRKFQQEQRALMTEQIGRQRRDWSEQDALRSAGSTVAVEQTENSGAPPTPGLSGYQALSERRAPQGATTPALMGDVVATMTGSLAAKDAEKPNLGLNGAMPQPQDDSRPAAGVEQPATSPTPVKQYRVAGQSYPSAEAAQAAAGEFNAPRARLARMYDVAMNQNRLDLAHQYKQAINQLESEGVVKFLRDNMPAGVSVEDIKAGKVADRDAIGVKEFNQAGVLRLPEGLKVRYTVDELGMPDAVLVDKDGNRVTNHTGNTLARIYNRANHLQDRQERILLDDKAANHEFNKRKLDITENYYTGMLDHKREAEANRLEIAGWKAAAAGRGGQGQSDAPVWDKDADKTLLKHYTVIDPTTGAHALDGDGLQFGKQVALARARAGGGDTTMAIGYAVAKDAQIRKLAGNDPVKLLQLRAGYLASLTGQGQDAPAPKPAAPAAPLVAKPAPLPEHSLMSDIFKPSVVQAGSDTRDALTRGVLWAGKYMRQP